jgi:hypothetical protein
MKQRDDVIVCFLCLTKQKIPGPGCFDLFSENLFMSQCLKDQQVMALARESLEFIYKPSLSMCPIQLHPPSDWTSCTSPYHAVYFNDTYGKGHETEKQPAPLASTISSRVCQNWSTETSRILGVYEMWLQERAR